VSNVKKTLAEPTDGIFMPKPSVTFLYAFCSLTGGNVIETKSLRTSANYPQARKTVTDWTRATATNVPRPRQYIIATTVYILTMEPRKKIRKKMKRSVFRRKN